MPSTAPTTLRNIAPRIHRQRVIVEARVPVPVTRRAVRQFNRRLAKAMHMKVRHLAVSRARPFGLGATCHWQYSGWALMCWDAPEDGGLPFITLDAHSCQPYDYATMVAVVTECFTPAELEWAPVLPELASLA